MKVLIVDDELKICLLIKELIDWGSLGLSFAGVETNGLAALQTIEKTRPDIVITDIRMPECSGLEIIKRCQTAFPSTHFIVISGYKEFEYLYQAMRLGVEDFLIKPVQKDELNDILARLIEKQPGHSLGLDAYINTGIANALDRRQFIDAVVDHPWAPAEYTLSNVNQRYKFHFAEGMFQAMIVKIQQPQFAQGSISEFRKKLSLEVLHLFYGITIDIGYNIQSNGLVIYLFNYPPSNLDAIQAAITKTQSLVSGRCQQEKNGIEHYSIGVGRSVQVISETPLSLHSALYTVKAALVLGANRILYADQILQEKFSGFNIYTILDFKFQKDLSKCIELQDAAALKDLIDQEYSECRGTFQRFPGVAFDVGQGLITMFFSDVARLNLFGNSAAKSRSTLLALHNNCFSLEEEEKIISTGLTNELAQIRDQSAPKQHYAISVAKQFINENLHNAITLDDIAKITYMNPIYLSVLFKKETGQNFSDYLTSARIDQAKELLADFQYSISQVAEMVGFKDPKYFSRLFFTKTGLRPKEYRQLCRSHLN